MTEETAEQLSAYINEKAEQFEVLRAQRHKAGAEEYGSITFLGNDVIRMMLEELADTANYCTMQAVKLLMLQEQLEQDLQKNDELLMGEEIGFKAFKGVKDVGWGNNK